jgi:hypothetical protein
MIGYRQAKENFFDRASVINAVDRGMYRVFLKFGAFTRATARKSLKYGDKPSRPGQPPTIHRTMTKAKTNRKTGATTTQDVSPYRENLFFSWDANSKSVLIGPTLSTKLGKEILPALEYGGESHIRVTLSRRLRTAKLRKIMVAARPVMQPAFEKEQKQSLPKLLANSVK